MIPILSPNINKTKQTNKENVFSSRKYIFPNFDNLLKWQKWEKIYNFKDDKLLS